MGANQKFSTLTKDEAHQRKRAENATFEKEKLAEQLSDTKKKLTVVEKSKKDITKEYGERIEKLQLELLEEIKTREEQELERATASTGSDGKKIIEMRAKLQEVTTKEKQSSSKVKEQTKQIAELKQKLSEAEHSSTQKDVKIR